MTDFPYPLLPLEHFVGRLLRGEPFSFSRWGDGEWFAVLGRGGNNCDGHAYFPAMGEDLRRILKSRPPYALGMQPLALRMVGEEIDAWLAQEGLDLPWINADVFHCANDQQRMEPLIQALTRRPLVIVGHPRLAGLYDMLKYAAFVPVPPTNCYQEKDAIVREIRRLTNHMSDLPVIGFSASMASNVMIDELYSELGKRAFLIDFGSLWDPYVGAVTREYHAPIREACLARAGHPSASAGPRVRHITSSIKRVRVGRFYPAPKRRYR